MNQALVLMSAMSCRVCTSVSLAISFDRVVNNWEASSLPLLLNIRRASDSVLVLDADISASNLDQTSWIIGKAKLQ